MSVLYYLIYGIWYAFSLLPFRVHYIISDCLFFFVFYVFHYRRRTAWLNIVTSFPERDDEEQEEIERNFYRWFCDYFVETVKLLTISESELKRRMVFKGTELVDKCVEEGQSCAVYLGHYCNWEWITSLPFWVSSKAECGQIYHPLENSVSDRLFLALRQRMGAICISMNDVLRKVVDDKRHGRTTVVGYISDQVPHWKNIHHWCDFLHHDTPVLTGTERLARRFNQAVFYLDVQRVRRGYYQAEFKLITREPQKMEEYQITDSYFSMLEQTIRQQPAYWLWTHNRWKRTREMFNKRFFVKDGKVYERKTGQADSWNEENKTNI